MQIFPVGFCLIFCWPSRTKLHNQSYCNLQLEGIRYSQYIYLQ